MPSSESATHQDSAPESASRLGLHDERWTHLVLQLMRWMPIWLVTALAYPVTLVIYILAVPQREALRQNLAVLLPGGSGNSCMAEPPGRSTARFCRGAPATAAWRVTECC